MNKPVIVTHLVAPRRWADYLSTGDSRGLDSDEVLACDRHCAALGDLVSFGPFTRTTRADPLMAEFTFVSCEQS